jgi:hypothetical protein
MRIGNRIENEIGLVYETMERFEVLIDPCLGHYPLLKRIQQKLKAAPARPTRLSQQSTPKE